MNEVASLAVADSAVTPRRPNPNPRHDSEFDFRREHVNSGVAVDETVHS